MLVGILSWETVKLAEMEIVKGLNLEFLLFDVVVVSELEDVKIFGIHFIFGS